MPSRVNVREIRKIARLLEYPKPNLPVPAVLVTCCLIDWLAKTYPGKDPCAKFGKYIEKKMGKTFQQLQQNDSLKRAQITGMDCSVHEYKKRIRHCTNSLEILYRHVRCGLVHDYSESQDCRILNRTNQRHRDVIIHTGKKFAPYALVLNAGPFVREFLTTL